MLLHYISYFFSPFSNTSLSIVLSYLHSWHDITNHLSIHQSDSLKWTIISWNSSSSIVNFCNPLTYKFKPTKLSHVYMNVYLFFLLPIIFATEISLHKVQKVFKAISCVFFLSIFHPELWTFDWKYFTYVWAHFWSQTSIPCVHTLYLLGTLLKNEVWVTHQANCSNINQMFHISQTDLN